MLQRFGDKAGALAPAVVQRIYSGRGGAASSRRLSQQARAENRQGGARAVSSPRLVFSTIPPKKKGRRDCRQPSRQRCRWLRGTAARPGLKEKELAGPRRRCAARRDSIRHGGRRHRRRCQADCQRKCRRDRKGFEDRGHWCSPQRFLFR